jgi:hypothetical protein
VVKTAQLSGERVLFLNYALYGSQADTMLFANWLLTKSDAELLVAHNMHVASHRNDGDAFLRQHGNTLLELPFPLFPSAAGFSAINQRLLSEWTAYVDNLAHNPSGGAPHDGAHAMFKRSAPIGSRSARRPTARTGGEPFLPITEISPGVYAADAADAAAIIRTHTSAITKLEKEIASLKRRPQQEQTSYQRGRGRGRGRQWSARGGEEADDPEPASPRLHPSPTLAPPTLLVTRSSSEGRVFEPPSAGGR